MPGGGSLPTLFVGIRGDGVLKYNLQTGEKTILCSQDQGENKLHNNWVASVFIDSKSRLWVGLFSGLACYDIKSGTFKVIDQTPFINKGACNSIRETPDGKLYIGTNSGLVIYNPDNDSVEQHLTAIDGLSDNDIRTLEIDTAGVAWIGSMRGISLYDPEEGKALSMQGYGLSERVFQHSVFSGNTGKIYFSGNMGYTQFRPETIEPVTFSTPVTISAIYLNGKRLTENNFIEGRHAIETDPDKGTYNRVNISHSDNNLLLRMSTMDFRDAANLTFEWMIEGEDDSWIMSKPGNSSIVVPKLKPGTHKLLVRAADNSAYSDVTELTIHVSSPWYLTTPAKIIYFLIISGILYLVFMLIKKKNTEEMNEAKVRFFMDISHEIRSPVTCIISPLQTLLKKEHDPETTQMLKGMHRNANRILSLANQLLELRKIDKSKKRLSMQETDVRGFASEIVELFRPMAENKSIEISLDAPDEISNVWIDRSNFDKVLVNLITNAIKYTPDGGKISVKIDTATDPYMGKCVRISVTDTGIGIDPKNITRIFERFYQGHGSASGFGVGLNLTRELVRLHHGTLTASNRTDGVKGSVFTVMLPLGKAHLTPDEISGPGISDPEVEAPRILKGEEAISDSTEANDTERRPRRNSTGHNILIVDDDSELREYLRFHFSRTDKVYEASNGVEAMKVLLDHKIDIVISDVVMPELDGLELLKAIKANADTSHTPVVLLSSRNDVADRLSGWDRGADGYIGKPFNISELDAMVDNLIDNRLRMKGKYSGAQDSCDKITAPELRGNDEMLMEKIIKAIENRIDDPQFNVESLGSEVGISRAHLHRKMKELIGMTPSDFIRNVRLRRACEILKKRDVDITQVAYNVGFTSQPHFSTAFKRFTGVSPTEYRARNIEDKEA